MPAAQRLARRVLRIPLAETSVERRRFRVDDPAVRARLESVGAAFLSGYHLALDVPGDADLAAALTERHDAFSRGFAYEGAGMALTFLDAFTPPSRRRFARFATGPGDPHTYLMHVGRGWAFARMRRTGSGPRGLDPLLGPLALDGAGFHAGYFFPERYVGEARPPHRPSRVFDQGLGRSLWFVEGADAGRVASRIGRFAPARRADLWSGVGLAAAYAGGAEPGALGELVRASGTDAAHVAQGAAFAAKARLRSGTLTPETEAAVPLLCGLPVEAAAEITDVAAAEVDVATSADPYAEWRQRIRTRLLTPAQEATA